MIRAIQKILLCDIKTNIKNNQHNKKKIKRVTDDIMCLSSGTKLKCKSNKCVYFLGDFIDSNNRMLITDKGIAINYINYDNQNLYEVIQ